MNDERLRPLELLTLLRLLCARGGRETHAATRRTLEPYLESWLGPTARAELLEETRERLRGRGYVTASGSRASSIAEAGREAILAVLAGESVPAQPAWNALRDTDCVALALGLSPPVKGAERKRLRSAEGLRAAVLVRTHDLPLPPFPTGTQAIKAMAWKRLAHLLDRTLDPALAARCGTGPVVEALASDWLGDGRRRSQVRTLSLAAAQATGARTPDATVVRRALLASWVRAAEAPTAARPTEPAPPETPRDAADPETFADRVLAVARTVREGRFGPDCIFISAVFDAWHREYPSSDLDSFKQQLAKANNQGLLHLQRADLVEAMDPDRVRRSRTDYLGSQFHFVRV